MKFHTGTIRGAVLTSPIAAANGRGARDSMVANGSELGDGGQFSDLLEMHLIEFLVVSQKRLQYFFA